MNKDYVEALKVYLRQNFPRAGLIKAVCESIDEFTQSWEMGSNRVHPDVPTKVTINQVDTSAAALQALADRTIETEGCTMRDVVKALLAVAREKKELETPNIIVELEPYSKLPNNAVGLAMKMVEQMGGGIIKITPPKKTEEPQESTAIDFPSWKAFVEVPLNEIEPDKESALYITVTGVGPEGQFCDRIICIDGDVRMDNAVTIASGPPRTYSLHSGGKRLRIRMDQRNHDYRIVVRQVVMPLV